MLDPGGEGDTVDRTIEDVGGIDPIAAQRCQEGHGAPVAERRVAAHALALAAPAMRAHHVGLDPGLVDEDEPVSPDAALIPLPARPPPRDVAPGLLGGQQRFFLKLIPSRLKKLQIAAIPALSPCSADSRSRTSASVRPGCDATWSSSHTRCP